uniref:Leucine-rich repeat-containing protein 52 n=1 Tax=Salvator merianae TaxID=96440 RepID=A0A8D0EHC5_SALMN
MGYFVLHIFHSSVILWIILLIALEWAVKSLGCPKECSCNTWEVNCKGKKLANFPLSVPLATKKLILSHNNLSVLPQLEMSFLNELIYLDCSHNQLKFNSFVALPGIDKLTYLDLSFNRLTSITPDTFSNLKKLILLNLSNNPGLVEIKERAFHNNRLLTFVDLSGCSLSYLLAEIFKDLHNLHIMGIKNNPWNCNCNFLEFSNWLKKTAVLYLSPFFLDAEKITCNKPDHLAGLTVLEAEENLHHSCLVHLEANDFSFMALIAFCIFSGGTLVAWLVGIITVIYYHPILKVDDESDDEEYRMI